MALVQLRSTFELRFAPEVGLRFAVISAGSVVIDVLRRNMFANAKFDVFDGHTER